MKKDEPNPEAVPAQKQAEEPATEKEAQSQALENEYAVLIDSEKSFDEQVKIGRPLFMSLLATGTVSKTIEEIPEKPETPRLSDTLAMMISFQTERQMANARKFLPFKKILHSSGRLNLGEILNTLIQQTILVMKQNKHFRALTHEDQSELCEVKEKCKNIQSLVICKSRLDQRDGVYRPVLCPPLLHQGMLPHLAGRPAHDIWPPADPAPGGSRDQGRDHETRYISRHLLQAGNSPVRSQPDDLHRDVLQRVLRLGGPGRGDRGKDQLHPAPVRVSLPDHRG